MEWKIYYTMETMSSGFFTPDEVYPADVQCIVQKDDAHGWQMLSGSEFYIWDNRGDGYRWWGAEHLFDLYEYLFVKQGPKIALKGRFLEDADFDRIHAEAMADPDFKKKTGYRANERKPTQELDT
jgi:hypothetical protein